MYPPVSAEVLRWYARRVLGYALLLAILLAGLPSTVSIWIDERGRTYLGNREDSPSPDAVRITPADLALRWDGQLLGPAAGADREADVDSSSERSRVDRELLAARDDIARGDTAQGIERLRRLFEQHPERGDVAWALARVERKRGRLEVARDALELALGLAPDMPADWREAAKSLHAEVEGEIEVASQAAASMRPAEHLDTDHFLISYDHYLAGRAYGDRVSSILKHVRARLARSLGRTLSHPLEVKLYTRTSYLERYQHRFGFATVGFYDGAIHVVSARHPRRELVALLMHEYVHALFADALGSHQPFYLNEGIADREEERARGVEELSRTEWRKLLDAVRGETWIPLATLVRGFAGLEGERALLAYLESRASVQMIEQRFPGAIARWLDRCAAQSAWETALVAETGWDTAALDSALREEVTSRFPADPLGGPHTVAGSSAGAGGS